jgi:hypothetical protein
MKLYRITWVRGKAWEESANYRPICWARAATETMLGGNTGDRCRVL